MNPNARHLQIEKLWWSFSGGNNPRCLKVGTSMATELSDRAEAGGQSPGQRGFQQIGIGDRDLGHMARGSRRSVRLCQLHYR